MAKNLGYVSTKKNYSEKLMKEMLSEIFQKAIVKDPSLTFKISRELANKLFALYKERKFSRILRDIAEEFYQKEADFSIDESWRKRSNYLEINWQKEILQVYWDAISWENVVDLLEPHFFDKFVDILTGLVE